MTRPSGLMLTAADTATRLDVDLATLKGWRRTGDGPRFVQIGRAVRYHPDDIARWVDGQEGHTE